MPSRFTGMGPYVKRPDRIAEWDYYDNCPLDPDYVSLAQKASNARKTP